jgi:Holliday junction resolvasome RuvABC ATP-dependent DNA helicase subunit
MANTPGLEAEIGHPLEEFNLATSSYLVAIIFGRSGYLMCQSSHGQVSDDDITLLYHTVWPFFAALDGAEALPALEADLDTRRQALKNLCTLDNPTGSLADEAETSLNAFRLLACYDQLRGVRPTSPAALTTKVRRALVRYLHTLADRDGTITDQERNAIDDLHERAGGLIEQGIQFAQQYPQVAAQLERSPFARHTLVLEPLPLEQATRPRRTGGRRSKAPKGQTSTQSSTKAGAQSATQPDDATAEILQELREMTGLASVKQEINSHINTLKVSALRRAAGLAEIQTTNHMVFTGNPGTGKTTVARLLAQIYRTLGVVQRGHLVETDRSGMVAGYVGQTAPLVTKVFDEADEGMLFIDEAYALSRGREEDFGREAIDQIVKLMEDRRDRVVLVVAGYPEEMEAFLSTNPGLRSRFPTVIDFPDYSTEEIVQIVDSIGAKQRYVLDDDARAKLTDVLDATPRTKGFGNARVGRNLYEAAITRHASRVMRMGERSDEVLTTLTADDVADAVDP